jgi:hypothetical protein
VHAAPIGHACVRAEKVIAAVNSRFAAAATREKGREIRRKLLA